MKTSGDINSRAKAVARRLWPVVVVLTGASLAATLYIRPDLLNNYKRWPALYAIPALVAGCLFEMWRESARGKERAAFLSSCAYLVFMLVGAAAGVYPNLLTSTTDPALNVTVYNAHAGHYALSVGLIWWSLGMAIAVGYFVFVYRMFRGKVTTTSRHGY
jgi:cytochrome d ubiquinol oxidase subunit II